jgi:hypothetical protein
MSFSVSFSSVASLTVNESFLRTLCNLGEHYLNMNVTYNNLSVVRYFNAY